MIAEVPPLKVSFRFLYAWSILSLWPDRLNWLTKAKVSIEVGWFTKVTVTRHGPGNHDPFEMVKSYLRYYSKMAQACSWPCKGWKRRKITEKFLKQYYITFFLKQRRLFYYWKELIFFLIFAEMFTAKIDPLVFSFSVIFFLFPNPKSFIVQFPWPVPL